MGIGFVFGFGILLFPETPRFDYRQGKIDKAADSISKFYGVRANHIVVGKQMKKMEEKFQAGQEGGDHPWHEVLTGPRLFYRVVLGMAILALQQLPGANYFFYYGTTVFASVGISNSYVTQIILGAVNVVRTFPGLWFVEKYGRSEVLDDRSCLDVHVLRGIRICWEVRRA